MASQKGLGRGLGALLGDLTEEPESTGGLKTLPLHKIEPNPNQPRRDIDDEALEALAESIRIIRALQAIAAGGRPVWRAWTRCRLSSWKPTTGRLWSWH